MNFSSFGVKAVERKDEEVGIFLLTILERCGLTQNEHSKLSSYSFFFYNLPDPRRLLVAISFFIYFLSLLLMYRREEKKSVSTRGRNCRHCVCCWTRQSKDGPELIV